MRKPIQSVVLIASSLVTVVLFGHSADAAACRPREDHALSQIRGKIPIWMRDDLGPGYHVYVSPDDCEQDRNFICWYPLPDEVQIGCITPDEALARQGNGNQGGVADLPPPEPELDPGTGVGVGDRSSEPAPAPVAKRENKTKEPSGQCSIANPEGAEVNIRISPGGDRTGQTLTNGESFHVRSAVKDAKGRWWAEIDGGYVNGGYMNCSSWSKKSGKTTKVVTKSNTPTKAKAASEEPQPGSCLYINEHTGKALWERYGSMENCLAAQARQDEGMYYVYNPDPEPGETCVRHAPSYDEHTDENSSSTSTGGGVTRCHCSEQKWPGCHGEVLVNIATSLAHVTSSTYQCSIVYWYLGESPAVSTVVDGESEDQVTIFDRSKFGDNKIVHAQVDSCFICKDDRFQ